MVVEVPGRLRGKIFKLEARLRVRARRAELLNPAPRKAYSSGFRQQWAKAMGSATDSHIPKAASSRQLRGRTSSRSRASTEMPAPYGSQHMKKHSTNVMVVLTALLFCLCPPRGPRVSLVTITQ